MTSIINKRLIAKNLFVSTALISSVCLASVPAFATIDNTVTVTGTAPDGTTTVQHQATESVDVEALDPSLVNQSITVSPSTGATTGNTVTVTTVYKNDGNQTLTTVAPTQSFDGLVASGATTVSSFTSTSTNTSGTTGASSLAALGPGDTVTFVTSYTVDQLDMDGNGGGDGNITASSTVAYDYTGGNDTTSAVTADATLAAQNASLQVAKTGFLGTDTTGTQVDGSNDNVGAGDFVTYQYVVTNNGNVTISGVSLSDNHLGKGDPIVLDADAATLTDNGTQLDSPNTTNSDGVWDTLAPGDSITVTATYEVVADDVELLQ